MPSTTPSPEVANSDVESLVDAVFENRKAQSVSAKESTADENIEDEDSEEDSDETLKVADEDDESDDPDDDSLDGDEDSDDDESDSIVLDIDGSELSLSGDEIRSIAGLKKHLDEQGLTFDKVQASMMMQKDYTQKTQKLSEESKQRLEAFQDGMNKAAEAIEVAEAVLLGELNELQGTDWAKLRDEDPSEFEDRFVRKQLAEERYQKISQAAQAAYAEYNKAYEAQAKEQAAKEVELLKQAIPEANSPKTWEPVAKKMSSYLESLGYESGEQVVNSLTDHRYFLVIQDAMRYREIKEGVAPAKKKVKQVSLKGGKPESKTEKQGKQSKMTLDSALQAGTTDAAIDAVADILSRSKKPRKQHAV